MLSTYIQRQVFQIITNLWLQFVFQCSVACSQRTYTVRNHTLEAQTLPNLVQNLTLKRKNKKNFFLKQHCCYRTQSHQMQLMHQKARRLLYPRVTWFLNWNVDPTIMDLIDHIRQQALVWTSFSDIYFPNGLFGHIRSMFPYHFCPSFV